MHLARKIWWLLGRVDHSVGKKSTSIMKPGAAPALVATLPARRGRLESPSPSAFGPLPPPPPGAASDREATRAAAAASASLDFMVSATLPPSSTVSTRTDTDWPGLTTSCTFSTNLSCEEVTEWTVSSAHLQIHLR